MSTRERAPEPKEEHPTPRPYEKPSITDLGTLAELTHANPTAGNEIDFGSTN